MIGGVLMGASLAGLLLKVKNKNNHNLLNKKMIKMPELLH